MSTPTTDTAASADAAAADSSSPAFPFWHPVTRRRAAEAAVAAARAAGLPPPPSPPSATYAGGCHCGALAFDVTLAPPLEGWRSSDNIKDDDSATTEKHPVLACNCSACRRFGYLLVYPARAAVTWTRGGLDGGPALGVQGTDAALGTYRFNSRQQDHLFCRRCGASVMTDFRMRWAPEFDGFGVSVRALRGVTLDGLAEVAWDGLHGVPPAGDLSGGEKE